MNNFEKLKLSPNMLQNLKDMNFVEMTEIQEQSLPHSLEGLDIIAQAKTGSGKTLAFGIPLLQNINVKSFLIQALILCPTRELSDQVATQIRKIARFQHNLKILTLSGGVPMRPQIKSLEHGAHVIVGTPGRIQDHLGKQTLNLKNVKTLVLDEADRMLDMGFYDVINHILESVSKKRQTLLFSATYEENIKTLSKNITINPKFITIKQEQDKKLVSEIFYKVQRDQKFEELLKLLRYYKPLSIIMFCNTKIAVQEVTNLLQDAGFSALDLHGDLDQIDRTETLIQFANRSCAILIATDVAARGLDIKEVDMVMNYDLPRDIASYTHRIGRTARAGKSGLAISLVDKNHLQKIEDYKDNPDIREIEKINPDKNIKLLAPMKTLCINGGKKDKLRAGDILGVFCVAIGLLKEDIGKIDLLDRYTYVSIKKEAFQKAIKGLQNTKIKKRSFKVWSL